MGKMANKTASILNTELKKHVCISEDIGSLIGTLLVLSQSKLYLVKVSIELEAVEVKKIAMYQLD